MGTGIVSKTNVRAFIQGQSHLKSGSDSLNRLLSDLNLKFKWKSILSVNSEKKKKCASLVKTEL